MRPFLLCAFSIFLGISPLAHAVLPEDAPDIFISAYLSAQQGEKEEQTGHLNAAISKLRTAAQKLDEIAAKFPAWNPGIVKYRKTRTVAALARIQEKIARGLNPDDVPKIAPPDPAPSAEPDKSAPKNGRAFEFNGEKFYAIPLAQ